MMKKLGVAVLVLIFHTLPLWAEVTFPYQAALDAFYQKNHALCLKYLALETQTPNAESVLLASLAHLEMGDTPNALAAFSAVELDTLQLKEFSSLVKLRFLIADPLTSTTALHDAFRKVPAGAWAHLPLTKWLSERWISERKYGDAKRVLSGISLSKMDIPMLQSWLKVCLETQDLMGSQQALTQWLFRGYKASEVDAWITAYNLAFKTQKTPLDFLSTPEALLQFSRNLYDRQDYGPFQKYSGIFMSRYPTHSACLELKTQRGVSSFLQKKYPDALLTFDEIISEYSGTYWAEKALYYKARSHFKLEESPVSKVLCLALIDQGKHPEWVNQAWVYLYWCFEAENDLPGFVDFYLKRTPQLTEGSRLDELIWKVVWEEYRMGNIASAYRILSHHPLTQSSDEFKAKALYWLGKMAKVCDPEKADTYFEECFTRYPFSFYASRLGTFDSKYSVKALKPKIKSMGLSADPTAIRLAELGLGDWVIQDLKTQGQNPQKVFTLATLYLRTNRPHLAISAISKGDTPLHFNGVYARELLELLYPRPFWDAVTESAREFGVDPYFALSLMREESRFNPNATSHVGAIGLMQLMPYTASGLAQGLSLPWEGPQQAYTPSVNIRLGIRYLAQLKPQFNNDYTQILAAYNAGPNATKRWIKTYSPTDPESFAASIPYRETHDYVAKVLKSYWMYRLVY
jgi:soluble lytic murein transglycosylase-like protein